MNTKSVLRAGAAIALFCAIVSCSREPAVDVPAAPSGPTALPWTSSSDNWEAGKAALQAFGEQVETSSELYEKLKADAGGGVQLTWTQMGLPAYDWSGIYTRTKGAINFDPDLPMGQGPISAKLTPEGAAVVEAKRQQLARTGGEYDPISDCRPPGVPRWHTEPFLHEFIVTPDQTWLVNEMVNDVRRVYTDGRGHTPDEDAYPSWNGDTIGFWDGDTLVMHTKHLMPGQYQRGIQPNYSDQVALVERWRKVDEKTLQADVWVFDSANLTEPWYTRQSWTELTNDDDLLRIRYWDCRENQNNDIIATGEGTSQFPDFDFVENDAEISSDADVKEAAALPGTQP